MKTHTHTHTSGPWVIQANGGSQVSIEKVSDGIRSVIAETFYQKLADEHGGDYQANARLIAAAPDLLQVAKDFLLLAQLHDWEGAAIDFAKATLAKAEGNV